MTTPTPIPVIFENSELVVVSKPEAMSVLPERAERGVSLIELLSKQLRQRLFAVYAMDKSVTGLVMFAKSAEALKELSTQLESNKLQQTFIALLHGVTKEKKGTIRLPLKKFGSGRMGIAASDAEGVNAVTRYELMERFESFTLVRLYPETQRRHQLRVHAYGVGHPIAGDPLYGDPALQKPFGHLLLHCHELEFITTTGEKHNITTPMPTYFGDAKKNLKR